MAVLDILIYPDERLRQPAEPVTTFDQRLLDFIQDLEETMGQGPGAVGIAAPQVNYFQQICIVDVSGRKKTKNHGHLVLINPEITAWEGCKLGREGCLSVPDHTGSVLRAENIQLEAYDPEGNALHFDMVGYEARAVQHEIDHLQGLLFLDRVVSRRNDIFKRKVYQT